MRKDLTIIRITEQTKAKIERLARAKGLKQITILEYLLNKKISLDELK